MAVLPNAKFKIGDTVMLKSGGPVMSVHTVPNDLHKYYTCQWFAGKKNDRSNFKEDELQAAEPKAPLAPAPDEKK